MTRVTEFAIRSRYALATTACLFAGLMVWPAPVAMRISASASQEAKSAKDAAIAEGETLARRQCVTCHAFPAPDTLPRAFWRPEVEKMALILEGKTMPGWGEPAPPVKLSDDYRKILAYYESRAMPSLPAPAPWPAPDGSPARFVRHRVEFKQALTSEPAVAHVRLVDLDRDGRPEALIGDMRQGLVLLAHPDRPERGATPLAGIPHPAHVSVADVDGDGRLDLLVSDLGEFLPGDHEKGAVIWLRAMPDGRYVPAAVGGGFPRVASVEAADVDGDGKRDLLVAAFGWRRTGAIALLLNRTIDASQPSFERRTIDTRTGAIHVTPADLNQDGRMDFVALFAQEHEAIVAFLGDGRGGFRPETLYKAPHPNWGSTGIQLVDFDRDGDLDVLATNGDMFDDNVLKPYHGIQWLENRGRLRFEAHLLAHLAGVHRALAADLDNDGDLDVAAAAFTGDAAPTRTTLPSLVWLERTARNRFVKHTIETGSPRPDHATLDVGDIDADGDADIVTGAFLLQGTSDVWLDVWRNQGKR